MILSASSPSRTIPPDNLEAIPGTWDSGEGWNEHRRGPDAKSQVALSPDIPKDTESIWAANKLAFKNKAFLCGDRALR